MKDEHNLGKNYVNFGKYRGLKKDMMDLIDNENPAVRDYLARNNTHKLSFHDNLYKVLVVLFDNNNAMTYDDLRMFISTFNNDRLTHYLNFLIYHKCVKKYDHSTNINYDELLELQFKRKDNFLYKSGMIKAKKQEFRNHILKKYGFDQNNPEVVDLVEERFEKFINTIFESKNPYVIYSITEKGINLLYHYINIYLLFGVSIKDLGIALSADNLAAQFREVGLDPKYLE